MRRPPPRLDSLGNRTVIIPENVALLTATVTPAVGVQRLARTDPRIRLEDYRIALKFYLSCLGRGLDRIVFADNSNSDVQPLRDLVAQSGCENRVEFVVFNGLDYPVEFSRCYGEMLLVDRVMELSQTLRQLKAEDIVWKITGRYRVMNLLQIIERRPKHFDVYCDLRSNYKGKWCDMRIFAWNASGYQSALRGIYKQLANGDQGDALEDKMYEAILPRLIGCRAVTSYRVEPYIEGARGCDNKPWNTDRQLLVYYIRHFQRLLIGRPVI